MVIRDRFADRHAAIERREDAEEEARKRDFVSTGDPVRDVLIQKGWGPSPQLQQMVSEIFSDAQFMLRQWLCDGKLQAEYRDPLFGGSQKIEALAWETEATDETIGNGTYYPFGRPMKWNDKKPSAEVKLSVRELDALLRGEVAGGTLELSSEIGISSSENVPVTYSAAKIEQAIQITAELLQTSGENLLRNTAHEAVRTKLPGFGNDKFRSDVWPVARSRLGMPPKGKPGPK